MTTGTMMGYVVLAGLCMGLWYIGLRGVYGGR